MTRLIAVIFLLSLFGSISGLQAEPIQVLSYPIADIPEDLRKDAKAVIRTEEVRLDIHSPTNAIFRVHSVVSVLTENGQDQVLLQLLYDKFIKIRSLTGHVYNAAGVKIKTFKKKDILDYSAVSSGTLFEDKRRKIIDPGAFDLPYTVEYLYEVERKFSLYYPTWRAQDDYGVAAEHSSFDVRVAPGNTIKYRERHLPVQVEKSFSEDMERFYWEVNNLPAVKWEPYSLEPAVPVVEIVAENFEMDGYKGSFSSWQEFGKWILKLNEGKQNLPTETKELIRKRVAAAKTDFEKIDIVYRYLQDKVRYVNIAIGVGGYQPYDAETVDRLSYGDCKALSNYTQACLKEAGIPSHYTLVSAGTNERPIEEDFPSQQFNHAFLCVPQNEDTIWLECTSQLLPTGYNGTFTDDRAVLLVDESGGKLVRTKSMGKDHHLRSSKIEVTLNADAFATIRCERSHGGMFYEEMIPFLVMDDARVKQALYEKIDLPQFTLKDYLFEEQRSLKPTIEEKLSLEVRQYGSSLGSKMLLPLNCLNRQKDTPPKVGNRRSDVFIKRAYAEKDTVVYNLPAGFRVDKVPKPVEVQSEFGDYRFSIETKDRQVIYTRYFSLNKGSYPKTAYNDLVDFFEAVVAADEKKFLLKKVIRP